MSSVGSDINHEIADDGVWVGLHAPELANHYFHKYSPDAPTHQFLAGYGEPQFLFDWEVLPDPYRQEEKPWRGVLAMGTGFGTFPLVVLPTANVGLYVGSAFSPGLVAQTWAPTLPRFATFAEPLPSLSNSPQHILGVILSNDLTTHLDTVVEVNGMAMLRSEPGGAAPSAPQAPARTLAANAPQGPSSPAADNVPPARNGGLVVFSRMALGIMVLGGTDAGGAPLSDLWFKPLDASTWGRVRLTGAASPMLGTVLAATYSFRDGAMWVLDQVPSTVGKHARLLRIDPLTGVVTVFGDWPHLNLGFKYYLSPDADGSVLLTATRNALPLTYVAHFNTDTGTAQADLLHIEHFRVLREVLADPNGYTFVKAVSAIPNVAVATTSVVHQATLGSITTQPVAIGLMF